MKMCDECGANPANIHLTQIMQNETQVFHLCEECARKKGISINVQGELETNGFEQEKSIEPDKQCAHCGLKYSDFRAKGWLGCSDCYGAFENEIDELLVQVHGSSTHKGKRYSGQIRTAGLSGEIKRLRQELAIAIKNEAFEQAAMLRDAIHNLKHSNAE